VNKEASREYSIKPNDVYDKILGISATDLVYVLSYSTESSQHSLIFQAFVTSIQEIYITQQVRTGCIPTGVKVRGES
jgi:hypothetical protein